MVILIRNMRTEEQIMLHYTSFEVIDHEHLFIYVSPENVVENSRPTKRPLKNLYSKVFTESPSEIKILYKKSEIVEEFTHELYLLKSIIIRDELL